ncbi:MAG TPA: glucose 1-dehydrogenase [bacterium]|nr:glucose 1-dehydrogenase [bacterium]
MAAGTTLQGKVAIVTGAARGIGRAIAVRFGAEGAHVVVNDLAQAGAEAVAAEITRGGGSAVAAAADVSVPAEVDGLIETAVRRFGTIDVLVNNAGLTDTMRHFLEADDAWWERVIAVNLTGAFLCSSRAARIMARKRAGVIIHLSSGGASRAHRGNAAYDAAKGGIEALTRAMALDLGPYGVRVNALVPGSIDTSSMRPDVKRARGENIPLGRVGEPEELAGPAVFLASDDARYITGHLLVVDGGLLSQQRSATVDIFPLSRFPAIAEDGSPARPRP